MMQTTPSQQMAVLISKGSLHMTFVLGSCKISRSLHLPTKSQKCYEALTGFCHVYGPDSLNTTSVSQGYIPEAVSGRGEGRQNPHSKDREKDEEPPIAGVQLMVYLAIIYSQGCSPTYDLFKYSLCLFPSFLAFWASHNTYSVFVSCMSLSLSLFFLLRYYDIHSWEGFT